MSYEGFRVDIELDLRQIRPPPVVALVDLVGFVELSGLMALASGARLLKLHSPFCRKDISFLCVVSYFKVYPQLFDQVTRRLSDSRVSDLRKAGLTRGASRVCCAVVRAQA